MQDLTLFNKDSAKAITQDIQVFNCELGSIRVIVNNGEPLFCLADLAHSLDFRDGTSLKKSIVAEFEPYDFKSYPLQTNQGMQKFSFIGESELYFVRDNMPYQKYIDSGYFEIIEQTYETPYGTKVSLKTLVTGKGQIYFTEKLRKETK